MCVALCVCSVWCSVCVCVLRVWCVCVACSVVCVVWCAMCVCGWGRGLYVCVAGDIHSCMTFNTRKLRAHSNKYTHDPS